jgi:betaine-aldehyde dehydrogenase
MERIKIINPCNGETIAELSAATSADVEAAINSARKAFDSGPWPKLALSERKKIILKIHQGILDKAAELARIESLNTGKPIKETTFMDIPSSAETFKYFGDNLESFLAYETIPISKQIANAEAILVREPMGVVLLIVPWNYPLLIASWKLAQALAAGNTVILKPSSLTPLSAIELGKIIKDSGMPEGVFNILIGPGDSIGEHLCSDKRVDMVSFTGSNSVGKKILQHASGNVKKMIMELGGKSASIILDDADIDAAVNGTLCSVFLNQGQMCTAMSRILVQDKIYDKFAASFVEKAKKIKLGDSADYETQMGPLISHIQRQRVQRFVENALKQKARILCGGQIPQDAALKKGFFFEPTVIADVSVSSELFREEVFGPVACLNKFSSDEEAQNLANASDFALASCIWSGNPSRARDLADKICAGTVWVNTYGMFFNELPYGGFKQSGFGKELGREGFLEYTRIKNILTDKTEGAKPLVNYWYGG